MKLSTVQAFLYPAAFLFLILGLWQMSEWIWDIPKIMLPSPLEIASVSRSRYDDLLMAAGITAWAAFVGFLVALVLGTAMALWFSLSVMARRGVYPYMIFLQTVPIVAIAPLIIIWFGSGLNSIVVIVAIISLFPIVTNVTTGLMSVDAGLLDLMEFYQANRWQVLFKLRLPHAVPYLLTGAKISSGLTIVGAVVGEYMAGHGIDNPGLGYYIFMSSRAFQMEMLFASIFLSTLLGVAMVGSVSLLSRTLLTRWTYQLKH